MKKDEHFFAAENGVLHYFEIKNDLEPLMLIHGQGVDATCFDKVMPKLAEKYHVYSVDCFGHGKSSHEPRKYNVRDIGDAVAELIGSEIGEKVSLAGHSSGGLIAAYVAGNSELCKKLYLEDPPLFSSQGERRYMTYNYVDLSSVCHSYLAQSEEKDFVLYYFQHQKAWDFFPPKSREKVYSKMTGMARKNRKRHPEGDLKVLFWPKLALEAFRGMSRYDPRFGEAFYDDSFHAGIPHELTLAKIECETVIMKAKTDFDEKGILLAAMTDEDARHAQELIKNSRIEHFDCGHGLHSEKKKQFLQCLMQ